MVDTLTLEEVDTLPARELQERARRFYLASLDLGTPLTDTELGERFSRSPRWGRYRIAEAKQAAKDTSPAVLPSPPRLPSLPPVVTPPAVEPSPVAVVPEALAVPAEPVPVVVPVPGAPLRIWPVLVLMIPAAVAIWGGWVGLGELAGFGPVKLLPGIADQVEINSAITLPVGMEVYASYSLYVWLSGKARGRARQMARWSTIAALAVGAMGQIAYHVMVAAGVTAAPWWITAGVACLPVAVLGMGAALAHMVRAEADAVVPTTAATMEG